MKLPNNIATTTEIKKEDSTEIKFSLSDIQEIKRPTIDYNDEKGLRRYIKSIESLIRNSLEYKRFIKYLKEEQDYTSCAFFNSIDIKEIKNVGIEFHHYPFTLYDIVNIVLYKESNFFSQQVDTFDIANEVMRIHYEGIVGLVPLSKTLHQLAHSGNLFINFKIVSGNIEKFMNDYEMFIDQELLDNVHILDELSEKNSEQSNKYILHKNFQTKLMEDKNAEKTIEDKKESLQVS